LKLPRDLSGKGLAKKMSALGYQVTRQNGSHLRLTSTVGGEHHVTVPAHDPLKVGTLSGILADVALHHKLSVKELAFRLFGA
jgi:predicted RNA binding protein YcfA (HicA-like mRNA interferase family)